MDIGGNSINGYWWLLMVVILVLIGGNFIDGCFVSGY
jgi:hypothetical protein